MNKIYTIILFFSPFFVNGQNDTLSYYEKNSKQKIKLQYDSLAKIKNTLTDGNYSIFYDKEKKDLALNFNVRNGNIDGLFRKYYSNGDFSEIGYYQNDSLWSYYSQKDMFQGRDTTFMIGNWLSYLRGLENYNGKKYKMPYDKDSLFYENWLYKNNSVWKSSVYHQRKGLINEKYYYYNGNLKSSFEQFPKNSIEQTFDTLGNLINIEIKDQMRFSIKLHSNEERYYSSNSQYKSEILSNPNGEGIQARYFYPNGNLKEFYDYTSRIKISYDEQGNIVLVEKRKKNGKMKKLR